MLNGTRTLMMQLKANIPSSMVLMGFVVKCFYAGQPRTCILCGVSDHVAAVCWAGVAECANLFKEEDFPPLEVPEDFVRDAEDVGALLVHLAAWGPSPVQCPAVPHSSAVSSVPLVVVCASCRMRVWPFLLPGLMWPWRWLLQW